ncbi:MAG: DUF1194 domain-containing protein [Alphaproteobacteria bacterium]|nr:DUF1194 domain-containing protein [Alphaproteobacteria bacterium]NNF25098.1 DUF1194 domain-containing protein [Paracoccaceae bacterium]
MLHRFLLCFVLSLPGATLAQGADPIEVDVELFLAVDVSRSMSPAELEIQRRGYAAALGSDAVGAAIEGGLLGRIAITYVEWAGESSQRIIVDWTLIESRQDARRVAELLTRDWTTFMRRTSISGAINYGAQSIDENNYIGLRRVIDISGDGPNNSGQRVDAARDAAVAEGLIINGLPIMTDPPVSGFSGRWNIDDLDVYYTACVIGGPGAFVIPVTDWAQFADAVRRKLVLEIAGRPPERLWRAQSRPSPAYDCLIGEKLRQRRQQMYSEP